MKRFLVFLMFVGCTGNKDLAILNQNAVRSPKPESAQIEVLTEKPTRAYTVVAMATVTGDERNLRDDIDQLRKKARAVGGDAVILKNSEPMVDRGPMRTTYQVTREGTIIRWK